MEYILTGIIVIGFIILSIFYIRTEKRLDEMQKLQKEDNSDTTQWNNIMMKQQETQTSVIDLQKNFVMLFNELNKLNTDNASSSQIITNMNSRIAAMNDIMVNKKSRGNWGEYQLNSLLSIYAGDNSEVFEVQYPLKNGYIGDVALHLPGNEKVLMIDSKFPMENYEQLIQDNLSDTEFEKYASLFKQNIKKHVNDISKKYITAETVDEAVMFIPSEAIYTYICAECSELINYAHSKHVLLTSPNTLLGVVFTLVNATKDFNRTKHIKDIEKTIITMSEDATRLIQRVEKVDDLVNKLSKGMKDVKTSSDKIATKIQKVSDGYIDEDI